ncbi:MAG: aminodeoxychorismate lyase, partial [Rhodococcus sp. (in: high G+C Gram-positive bacteria)]
MNNQGPDRDRRDARSDEAHTDPIGYSVDEGSEFDRRMQGHPQRQEPHPRASRNADREAEAGPGAVPQEVGRSRAASRKDRAASSRKRRGRLV